MSKGTLGEGTGGKEKWGQSYLKCTHLMMVWCNVALSDVSLWLFDLPEKQTKKIISSVEGKCPKASLACSEERGLWASGPRLRDCPIPPPPPPQSVLPISTWQQHQHDLPHPVPCASWAPGRKGRECPPQILWGTVLLCPQSPITWAAGLKKQLLWHPTSISLQSSL